MIPLTTASTRTSLASAINKYKTSFSEEVLFIPGFAELLKHPRSFYRDHLPGHMTGSAWILDESRQFVLLTHHAKLNRWLQPGGHADGDENIFAVAHREAVEETGLQSIKILSETIFDIDIHTIPERKDFPRHDHYDVRVVMTATRAEKFTVTSESHDLAWIHLDEIGERSGNNTSMMRMAEKTRMLFGTDQQ